MKYSFLKSKLYETNIVHSPITKQQTKFGHYIVFCGLLRILESKLEITNSVYEGHSCRIPKTLSDNKKTQGIGMAICG